MFKREFSNRLNQSIVFKFLGNMTNFISLAVLGFFYAWIFFQYAETKAVDGNLGHKDFRINFNGMATVRNSMDSSQDDPENEVLFYLFNRQNKDVYQQVKINDTDSLKASTFDPQYITTIIIHGYMDSIDGEMIKLIKDNILENEVQNVFGVDWSALSNSIIYSNAATETKTVGDFLGSFIEFLVSQGMDLKKTHLIGHSLGAHVAGLAGFHLAPNKIARVTGLDPARPGFEGVEPNLRLDAIDADFVDCIHTRVGEMGTGKPYCSADFYAFSVPPDCPWFDIDCTNGIRSYQYYAESIQKGHLFKSLKCAKVPIDGSKDTCTPCSVLMGEPADPSARGYFYVATNSQYPFANVTRIQTTFNSI